MGEWSKKIGEHGENIIEKLFEIIGWNDMIKGIDIPCSNKLHKNKNDNQRNTHGIDFIFSYMNPLVSEQLSNVLISAKYKTIKYPNSAVSTFKGYINDLRTALECYEFSEFRDNNVSGFETSSINDAGVLVWLNNNSTSDDLISKVSTARVTESDFNKSLFIVDNKRVAFLLEVMEFIKTKADKYDYSFYYPNTGRNINPVTRENDGKILPLEYLNSSIIPIKLVNKNNNNNKEKSLVLATIDNFEDGDFIRLIGLSKDISTELVGEVVIAFPDYDKLKHETSVLQAKQKFQVQDYTKNVRVVNYTNPLSAFLKNEY